MGTLDRSSQRAYEVSDLLKEQPSVDGWYEDKPCRIQQTEYGFHVHIVDDKTEPDPVVTKITLDTQGRILLTVTETYKNGKREPLRPALHVDTVLSGFKKGQDSSLPS